MDDIKEWAEDEENFEKVKELISYFEAKVSPSESELVCRAYLYYFEKMRMDARMLLKMDEMEN